jgi:hypothetical protein
MLRYSNEMQLNNSERQITSKRRENEGGVELVFAERRGSKQKAPDSSTPSSAPFLPINYIPHFPLSSPERTPWCSLSLRF